MSAYTAFTRCPTCPIVPQLFCKDHATRARPAVRHDILAEVAQIVNNFIYESRVNFFRYEEMAKQLLAVQQKRPDSHQIFQVLALIR